MTTHTRSTDLKAVLRHPDLDRILDSLRAHDVTSLDVVAVAGSGLARIIDHLAIEREIAYADIDGYPLPTIPGHPGKLVVGALAGKRVGVFVGRFHSYEGAEGATLTLPVQVAAGLGAKTVLLTTSVGGVNPSYRAGDVIMVRDHLNLMGTNPLLEMIPTHPGNAFAAGNVSPFISTINLYRTDLYEDLRERVAAKGGRLQLGVLTAMTGPNFETPAEVRMVRMLGGDAVCMSTVPETLYARYAGVTTIALACVTNVANDGTSDASPSHEEVLAGANAAAEVFAFAVAETIRLL